MRESKENLDTPFALNVERSIPVNGIGASRLAAGNLQGPSSKIQRRINGQ